MFQNTRSNLIGVMTYFLYSNIKNLPVASLAESQKVGRLTKVLVDLDRLEIIGFLIRENFFSIKFLSLAEITELDKRGVVIESKEKLARPDEIVRVQHIIKNGIELISLPVKTQNNKFIGRITDFVFESESGKILKFYLQFFLHSRIISRANVIRTTPQKMVVENDSAMVGASQLV